jgi:cytochrome c
MRKLLVSLLVSLFFVGVAFAGGTDKEAISLVEKAAAYMKANGKEKAYSAFNDQKGKFVDRDLYIFVFDFNGVMKSHGANEKLIGKNLAELKDAEGKFFVQKMVEVAKKDGKGWVDYQWTNPVTKKIEPKSSYVQTLDDVFLGCGIYK